MWRGGSLLRESGVWSRNRNDKCLVFLCEEVLSYLLKPPNSIGNDNFKDELIRIIAVYF